MTQSDATSACMPITCHLQYNTIQELQVIAPPKRQVCTGAPRGPERVVTQHAQSTAQHELHTLGGNGGTPPTVILLKRTSANANSNTYAVLICCCMSEHCANLKVGVYSVR
jgi:hypothetical protein